MKTAFPGTRKSKVKQMELTGLSFVRNGLTERERQREEIQKFTEKQKDPEKRIYLLAEGDVASVKCPSCDHVGATVKFAYGPGMRVQCCNCNYSWRTERDREASPHDASGRPVDP